jgi:hypothetical protein
MVGRIAGVLLVVVALAAAAIGAFWALFKASGAEADICPPGSDCTSGWVGVAVFAAVAVVAGSLGFRLLRGDGHGTRSR